MKTIAKLFTGLLLVSNMAWAHESPQALQDAFVKALRAGDAAGLAACYSADAVNFPVGEMVGIGPEAVEASWNGYFSAYTVLEANLTDTVLESNGETSFAWGLWHMRVQPTAGGEPVEMHGRFMDVARNFDGQWLYIADHASVPAGGE